MNENSRIWKDKENKLESKKNIKKVFLEDKKITTEFNQELKLDLSKIKFNDKITDDKNNYGSQNYEGLINKIGNYEGTIGWMESLGMPGIFLMPAIILEVGAPILIIIGYKVKISAALISLFCIATTIIFHNDFSNQMQIIAFLKNIGLAGGLLFFAIKDKINDSHEELDDIERGKLMNAFKSVEKDVVRKSILSNEPRIDGRDLDTVRPIFVETDVLPSAHTRIKSTP